MAVTILEGSTFCICDERGDVDGASAGLYAEDTRFLSRLVLTINGERPLLLSSRKADHHRAVFFLRNPIAGGLERDELSIVRERVIADGLEDVLVVRNHARRTVELEVAFDVEADFADIFSGKNDAFTGESARRAPAQASTVDGGTRVVLADGDASAQRTEIVLSEPATVDGSCVGYRITLEPRAEWRLCVDVLPLADGTAEGDVLTIARARARGAESLAAWRLAVPRLRAPWVELERLYERSVADLGSLRMQLDGRVVIAAGMPWFMTVFGRDTVMTALQTLLLGGELPRNALLVLADLQAEEDDPDIDAEPGKIVHEMRRGKGASAWLPRYYGSVDVTPLYLVLLSEVWRWTDDGGLVAALRGPALRALEWIDSHGDRDGDGFVEYLRRSNVGNANQSWKDSWDSQVFHDGSIAAPPLAPAEVQGYVYDAKLRTAELAREVWRDRGLAERLRREAAELRDRFDEAFWIADRGGYYALALDGDKRRVDGRGSNMGHLLWSGIVPEARADAVVDALMREDLWSGWGIRTLAASDGGFNPIGYHTGTVWPHDTAIAVAGLARYGRWDDAFRLARGLVEAGAQFDYQLPEAIGGFTRDETPFAVAYPTATRPQAWAAGSAVFLLQTCLGLRPIRERAVLVSEAPRALPSWLEGTSLTGVRAFDESWRVDVRGGSVVAARAGAA
jgi:glycogen debranching enzyme